MLIFITRVYAVRLSIAFALPFVAQARRLMATPRAVGYTISLYRSMPEFILPFNY